MTTIHDLMSLKGKRALITGGGGHVAPILAGTLLELGADVCLTDHSEKVAAAARQLGLDDSRWIIGNLTHEPDMSMVVRFSADRMGGLDIIVHAAALTGTGPGLREGWAVPFEHQSVQAFRYSMDLAVTSAFVMAQELKEEKKDGTPGVMVILSSIYGILGPQPSLYQNIDGIAQAPAGYSAAKSAQLGLVRYLASVLAPSIRVNALVPGGLLRGQPEEFVSRYSARTPLQRMGTEDDLRGALAFLCSDMSKYVTGQVLQVDGGWTIW